MLIASNGIQYLYDALNQRVDKVGGPIPGDTIYFGGTSIALWNTSTHAWTDLIWANGREIATVPGTQTAPPVYRLLDHEGSLVMTTDSSGNMTGSNIMSPYGQTISSNTSDTYTYASLYKDAEYGGDAASFRNYSESQIRWTRPDPYNGSYDPSNPQSMNCYTYVADNPLTYTDPTGLQDDNGTTTCNESGDCATFFQDGSTIAIINQPQTTVNVNGDDSDGDSIGGFITSYGGGGAPKIATISAYHPSIATCLGQAAISMGEDLLGLSMLPGSDQDNWRWQNAGLNSGFVYTGAGELLDSSVGLDVAEKTAGYVADTPAAQGTIRRFLKSQGVNRSMKGVATDAATVGKWAGRAAKVTAAYSAYVRYQNCRGD